MTAVALAALSRKYDEINEELAALADAWESADHGGLTREEYGAKDAALVAERKQLVDAYVGLRAQNALAAMLTAREVCR